MCMQQHLSSSGGCTSAQIDGYCAPTAAAGTAAPSWSGPDIRSRHGNGWPMLSIDGEPAPAQWLVVHSLGDAGNASSPPHTAFDIQVASAASAGIRFVEMPLTGDCCVESELLGGEQVIGVDVEVIV